MGKYAVEARIYDDGIDGSTVRPQPVKLPARIALKTMICILMYLMMRRSA